MKVLLAQLAKLGLILVLCHLGLLGLSLWIYPPMSRVDTAGHADSLFRDQFRAAVNLALESGLQAGEQLVVVGPSNAVLAFRPDEVESLMPGVRVHNLATASMRSDETRQLVQYAWSIMSEAQRRQTTFVVALIFASFPSRDSIYLQREAGIAHSIRETGVFREEEGRFLPFRTGTSRRAVTLLRRPLALVEAWRDDLDRLLYGARKFASAAFLAGSFEPDVLFTKRPPPPTLFPRADSAEGRKTNLSMLRYFVTGRGTALGPAQFEELRTLVRWAGESGARLQLVGMPVPDWVRTGLPYFDDYRDQLEPILREVDSFPSVRFVDLHDADLPMWDSTHPNPARSEEWAAALASSLRSH